MVLLRTNVFSHILKSNRNGGDSETRRILGFFGVMLDFICSLTLRPMTSTRNAYHVTLAIAHEVYRMIRVVLKWLVIWAVAAFVGYRMA